MIPQTKHESLDCGIPTFNSPVVGGASGYGFHPPPQGVGVDRKGWVPHPGYHY